MLSLCVIQLKAMQHQDKDTGRYPSSSKTETSDSSVYIEATHEEDTQLAIDFDNVEDILDFSVRPLSEAPNRKQRPKQRKKITATEPVKLLELKPKIDNFNGDEQNSEMGHEVELKSIRRFQCIYCGSKFIRSTHLQRHLRIHTGDKPYACHICRRRFSRSDYKAAHVLSHRREKTHRCYVCGQAYHDLTTFTNHCYSHDDSEYIRIAMRKEPEIVIGEDPVLPTTFKEEMEEIYCIPIEKVDNSTTEECIECVENPLYLHHPITPIKNNTIIEGTSLSSSSGSNYSSVVS